MGRDTQNLFYFQQTSHLLVQEIFGAKHKQGGVQPKEDNTFGVNTAISYIHAWCPCGPKGNTALTPIYDLQNLIH